MIKEVVMVSPNKKNEMVFEVGTPEGNMFYTIKYNGEVVVGKSRIALELEGQRNLEKGFEIIDFTQNYKQEDWENLLGENKYISNRYNHYEIALRDDLGRHIIIEVRNYDEGIGMRYKVLATNSFNHIAIKNEWTEFAFTQDHYAFATYCAQGAYEKVRISQLKQGVERPLVIELEENKLYLAVAEAGLVDYSRMKLNYIGNQTLRSGLTAKPLYAFKEEEVLRSGNETEMLKYEGNLPFETPWRVFMIGASAADLYHNNTLIMNLNEPCKIEDCTFIEPGKVIRVLPLTTSNGKACVDFAEKRNLQYIEIDAGWYGDENDFDSDATYVSVDPARYAGEFDLFEIIAYAKAKAIKVILYINHRAMLNQLDELLPLYKSWGIDGIKYGFVEVGTQRWTTWLHECIRKAADHEMVLTIHDEYRPTGYSRTYPNLLTQEGIRGDEERQPASNTLMIVFTRMLAGAGDNTVCYYDQRVDEYWSHAYQLAKSVVLFSPLQFLYWYDSPDNIDEGEELIFFDKLVTVWDETKVINGEIGKYVTMARRTENEWFVGGMNADETRDFEIKLDFLVPEQEYRAWIYSDDETLNTRTKVKIETISVNNQSIINLQVKADNGFALRIEPIN